MLARRMRPGTMFTPSAEGYLPNGGLMLASDLDRLVRDVFGAMPAFPAANHLDSSVTPALNAWEDDENVYVEAELPGYSEGDISVSFEKGVLTLSGRREQSTEQKNERFIRRERTMGEFSRTIALDSDIEQNGVEATLRNGVLLVTLPKSKTARARKIAVRRA